MSERIVIAPAGSTPTLDVPEEISLDLDTDVLEAAVAQVCADELAANMREGLGAGGTPLPRSQSTVERDRRRRDDSGRALADSVTVERDGDGASVVVTPDGEQRGYALARWADELAGVPAGADVDGAIDAWGERAVNGEPQE